MEPFHDQEGIHMKKFLKVKYIIPAVVVLLVLGLTLFGFIYVNDYYPATDRAVAALSPTETPDDGVTVTKLSDKATLFSPEDPVAGFIIYPGGKVDHVAYAPLARSLASRGIACVLMKMPLRLAVLDADAADGVVSKVKQIHPDVSEWYIGGHSLGGSMAASYVGKHADRFAGLILLAAYSTEDLSDTDLRVLSLLGSEDRVLNREKYDKYKKNLPDGFVEESILGGNHAGFGDYGVQDGDGISTLPDGSQMDTAVGLIAMFIHARES